MKGLLLGYCVVVTTLAGAVLVRDAVGGPSKASYDELDVKRINLREEDGTLRLVISNKARFPGIILRGKEHPHPNRKTAGFLFFNEEGTENGGLIFDGKRENGKVSSGGHLSFDQYEQDQVIQLTQSEFDGNRWAAMIVSDRPDAPLDMAAWQAAEKMPDGPAKQAEMKRLGDLFGGKQRLFVGKSRDRSSALMLNDAAGRPRLLLQVSAEGAASIQFLDETGKVVRKVGAAEAKGP
ncbi:MAG TPA: hypothetical protein VGQ22_22770 [Steroidobacteraceae bacterium]|nr:hypothetical protein [Steroidobacteraceae bacterium]